LWCIFSYIFQGLLHHQKYLVIKTQPLFICRDNALQMCLYTFALAPSWVYALFLTWYSHLAYISIIWKYFSKIDIVWKNSIVNNCMVHESNCLLSCSVMKQLDASLKNLNLPSCFPLDYLSMVVLMPSFDFRSKSYGSLKSTVLPFLHLFH